MRLFTIFTFVFALLTVNAYADNCLEGRSISKDNLGNIVPSEGERCFENVFNQSGATISAGMVATFDNSQEDSYSVATSSTAGANPKCVMVADCVDDALCSCQTYGYSDSVLVEAATATGSAGEILFISEISSGYAAKNTSADPDVDTPVGFLKEALSATGATKVFINLR